ncbi:MAG: hypothetical protein IIB25_03350, partial [Chloroflexi bacterium]|nr:hypothetical protein [Chloroflexota bacterium]
MRSNTTRTPTGLNPDVQSIMRRIDDALIRSAVPEDFFPDFDRIASDLLQYDRMAISFYVNLRFQAEYAYVSGTVIENHEQGTLHPIPEDAAWTSAHRNGPFHLGEHSRHGDRVFDGFDAVARSSGLRSGIAAPIMWRGVHVGDLALRSSVEAAYTGRDLELIDMLVNKISGVVVNARAVSQARYESNRRESLLELSRLVNSVRSLHQIQDQFGEIVCSLIDADRISITVPGRPVRAISTILVHERDANGYGFGKR